MPKMTITRKIDVITAYDAAGNVADMNQEDIEITVDLTGSDWQKAEPDVGIMSEGYTFVTATDDYGEEILLSDAETEHALVLVNEDRIYEGAG